MTDLLPEGEGLRRAVQWLSSMRRDSSPAPLAQLIEQASQRFDLSPLDQEFLWRQFAKGTGVG